MNGTITLREFTNHMYYITPMTIKHYQGGNILFRNITPRDLQSVVYNDICKMNVHTYGLNIDENGNTIFEVQIG